MESEFFKMFALSEKLRSLAKLNFCKNCYSKYLDLIHGEIESLLSEPIFDWKQAEANIDIMWIKAKELYSVVHPTVFSPHKNAFQKAKEEKLWKKLKFLKEKGTLHHYTNKYLDQVSKRRNKIHSLARFSKQDYDMFREAKELTDIMFLHTIRDLKDEKWKNDIANVEKRAKLLLERSKPS